MRSRAAARLLRATLGSRLPSYSGERTVAGIDAPVEIRRDRFAVPHIYAMSATDAYFGLGFCHGQDRSFQLEILLRLGRGTLAELVGEVGLPIDRLARRLGLWLNGKQRHGALGDATRAIIDAYAAGVRAGRADGRRPHELALLRARPTPFTSGDVLALLALEGFLLSANWDVELTRLLIADLDGAAALEAIDPVYPHWHPVASPPGGIGAPLRRLADDIEALREWAGMAGASNAWALAPSRTATGRPILANDPHLAPTLPPHWYLCHLATPDWALAGASFVGAPGVPAGHNGHAAWGVTAGLADIADLFIEQVGPDGRSVLESGGYVPCHVRTEVIGVRGKRSVVEDVLITRRGPIISPALDAGRHALSMQATWMAPRTVSGLALLHEVGNFEDFRRIMAPWPASSFGLAYADADGHIGYLLSGELPRRRRGDGTVPLPAWEDDVGWEAERVPPEENPAELDPDTGFVATANNRPSSAEHPWLGVDFIDGYRAARIVAELERRRDWDVYDTMDLQLDVASQPWAEVGPSVLAAIAGRAELKGAHEILEEWDGRVSAGSVAASLYELFMAEMDHRIVVSRAPRSARWAVGLGYNPILPFNLLGVRRTGRLSELLRSRPAGWFEDGWEDAIAAAMAHAWQRARGEDGRLRPWGELRPLFLRHPLGSRGALGAVFDIGPIRWGGDANTISQAGPDPLDPTQPTTLAIAALRCVIDVGEWERSRFVLPGGQSGNPLSDHYDDQLPLWRHGDGVPIAWHRRSVEEATHETMTLQPPATG